MPKKYTTTDVVERFRLVHGDRYDYSRYIHSRITFKSEFICLEHGSFWQRPYSHLAGQGCPRCGDFARALSTTKSSDDFIAEAREIHPDLYGYDRIIYRGAREKVEITCPEHGPFWQAAYSHLAGCGCPKCGRKATAAARLKDRDQFISEAREIHPGLYGYEHVDYRYGHAKAEITCPEHGPFWQEPSRHLQGHGCPKCGRQATTAARTKSSDDFIAEAREIHHGLYGYDRSVYCGARVKVEITCHKHGPFWQKPDNHLSGQGCPRCSASKGELGVAYHFERLGLKPEREYRFVDCRDVNPLPFDFVFFYEDVKLAIEFQGEYHYRPVTRKNFGEEAAKAKYDDRVRKDAMKKAYCAANGIPLLEIPYWDKHRIPELVDAFLAKHLTALVVAA